ncbi:hypothetical protein T08_629 [Trichinella sp. T8]|nr:hypothetical protein T08_629 [Trichinella sp. T8]
MAVFTSKTTWTVGDYIVKQDDKQKDHHTKHQRHIKHKNLTIDEHYNTITSYNTMKFKSLLSCYEFFLFVFREINSARQLASSNLACKQDADMRYTCHKRCNSNMRQFLHDFDASPVSAVASSTTTFSWKSANWLQLLETAAARTMQNSHFSCFKLPCALIALIAKLYDHILHGLTENEFSLVVGLLFYFFTASVSCVHFKLK